VYRRSAKESDSMAEKAKKAEKAQEKEGSPKSSSKDAIAGMWSFSRSALPYLIAALVAAAAMAWYFFIFVPGKLEYFVSLRFRTLAVASGHIQNKVENLAKALTIVPTVTGTACETLGDQELKYIGQVLPDIQVDKNNRPATVGLRLPVCGTMATIAWSDLVAQASSAAYRDFDDLILADENGDVRWQREISTPRIGNLSELVGAPDDSARWSPFQWRTHVTMPVKSDSTHLRSTALLKPVSLGGISSLLLVQSVPVPTTMSTQMEKMEKPPDRARHLYVAGLVSNGRLQSEAMRIPVAWLVFFAVPVAILFLALPFVKLATLTAKERFSFVDVVAMTLATIAAVGLGAIVPFATMSTKAADLALDTLAGRIEKELARETSEVLKLADDILTPRFEDEGGALGLLECPVGSGLNRPNVVIDRHECELWQALGRNTPMLDLDVVIWFDDKGEQLRKWTTKAQITGRTPHRPFDHYRNLVGESLWKLAPGDTTPVSERKFTIDPLRAPTTAELGVVFAMPLDAEETKKIKDSTATEPDRVFFGLNVRPQSVVDSVVAPGYGFAIIAPGGKVLFHSEEGLSLEENFFEEVGNPADVREKAQSRRLVRWTGDYHGRPHRFRMQPISSLVGSPWLIVTFQEMEPVLTALVLQQRATLRLGTLNLLLFVLIVLVIAFRYKIRRRRIRDLTQDILARSQNTRRAWFLIALAAIEIIALAFVRDHADAVYFTFVAVPVTAVLVTLLVRKWPAAPRRDDMRTWFEPARDWMTRLVDRLSRELSARAPANVKALAPLFAASELGVLVIVISALPAVGFARIAQVVKDHDAQERWAEAVQQEWSGRQARMRERINGPNYSATTKNYLRDGFAKEVKAPNSVEQYSFLPEGLGPIPSPPGHFVRDLLEWSVLGSTDQAVRAASEGETDAGSDSLPVALTTVGAATRTVSRVSLILGVLILTGFLIAAYWARSRLLPPAVIGAPDLDTLIANVSRTGNEIVLLVGPPRSGKDHAVVRAVSEHAQHPKEPPVDRIPLLDKTLDDAYIQRTVRRVKKKVDEAIQLRGASPNATAPVWIHLSNLEAQLLNEEKRTRVLRLLEELLDINTNQPPRALVITSTIDPIAHFRELFTEERQGVYTDLVPEVSLGRSALIMSRFRRCYAPIGPSKKPVPKKNRANASMTSWHRWWHYDPREWPKTLGIELDGYRPFAPIRDELRRMWNAQKRESVPFDELLRAVRLKTEASYELLWASCTRSEKLVLIQLAQEGFVTAQSWDVVAPLVAKGIIVQSPGLAIFNRSFRDFLRGIERSGVVREWEQMEGSGLWVVSGRLIGSSLLAGGLFYLTTQDFSVQSLLPILSGTGLFSVPLVRSLFARLPGKPDTEMHA
jgi:hypothetical protein